MLNFIFFTHFLRFEDALEFFPNLQDISGEKKCFSNTLIRKILKSIYRENFNLNLKSFNNIKNQISGVVKFIPYLPKNFIKENETEIQEAMSQYLTEVAPLGAKLVGLGGFSSMIGDRGVNLSTQFNLSVTTGNTLTAASVINSVLNLIDKFGLPRNKIIIAVVGASGDIGSACVKTLANYVDNFALAAQDLNKLKNVFRDFQFRSEVDIKYFEKINDAVKLANIVIIATSSPIPLFDINSFSPGTIVCDASYPSNVVINKANPEGAVLFYEGGKILVADEVVEENGVWQKFFPDNIIFGCLAETIILSLERKYENYSIGRGNIDEEKIKNIYTLAQKHGFSLPPLKWKNVIFNEKNIERIISLRK